MNIEELRTFLEIIDTGSLAAAAKRVHVTPSTVTARIDALEEQLGCQLLHRNRSGAELTSAGFKLQRYAELMTQLWRQARYEVALPPGVAGACNVGLEFSLWREVGSRFLEHVRAKAPDVAIAVWPGEERQLHRWLDTGLIDVAFCYSPQAGDGYASRLLCDDELLLVSARDDANAELDGSYVYVDHGDEFRRQHAEAFPAAGPSLVTIATSDWALEFLERTGAKGYLPRRVAAGPIAAGRLHRVDSAPAFVRHIYVVESVRVAKGWAWYEAAVEASRPR
jgi:LysR family transcriptional regulator, flagellar master operon regulator